MDLICFLMNCLQKTKAAKTNFDYFRCIYGILRLGGC